jgi:hypothetical protein
MKEGKVARPSLAPQGLAKGRRSTILLTQLALIPSPTVILCLSEGCRFNFNAHCTLPEITITAKGLCFSHKHYGDRPSPGSDHIPDEQETDP